MTTLPRPLSESTARTSAFVASAAARERMESVRALFPALAQADAVFLDNAGGSQLPACVIDAAANYMRTSYAQLGGEYGPSRRAAETVKRAHELVKLFVNAAPAFGAPPEACAGEVILGASSTALCHLMANAYADARAEAQARGDRESPAARRDEIVVSSAGHEANIGPWLRLRARGFRVTFWPTERDSRGHWRPRLETLRALLSERTRVVAFPQVSNILGEVWDARAVARAARDAGAHSVIDGVAYAPHHPPDVRALGCDWYVYSTYKVFGPHMGALFGRHEALRELTGPNHEFIARDDLPRKFEPGGSSHEGCAAIAALWDFACALNAACASAGVALAAGRTAAGALTPPDARPDGGVLQRAISERAVLEQANPDRAVPERATLVRAFESLVALERGLQTDLLRYLAAHPRLRIIGPNGEGDAAGDHADGHATGDHGADTHAPGARVTDGQVGRGMEELAGRGIENLATSAGRVATVSVLHESRRSGEIAREANAAGLGIRFGHFYSKRLIEEIARVEPGLDATEGVVRISLLGYNTPDELERLFAHFDRVL